MSQQTDLLREFAAAMKSGAAYRISDWFTEDFRLHEPGKPAHQLFQIEYSCVSGEAGPRQERFWPLVRRVHYR